MNIWERCTKFIASLPFAERNKASRRRPREIIYFDYGQPEVDETYIDGPEVRRLLPKDRSIVVIAPEHCQAQVEQFCNGIANDVFKNGPYDPVSVVKTMTPDLYDGEARFTVYYTRRLHA